jgi:hypothetical protein
VGVELHDGICQVYKWQLMELEHVVIENLVCHGEASIGCRDGFDGLSRSIATATSPKGAVSSG